MTTTITISMSGTADKLYDALERHHLPTRGVAEVIGEPRYATVELPDSTEVRERLKHLGNEMHGQLMAVSVTTVYMLPMSAPPQLPPPPESAQ